MGKKNENKGFICDCCGQKIMPVTNGGFRNHCPFCLHSKHLDLEPGDRNSQCDGLMKPIGLKYSSKKGFQIIHQCLKCRQKKVNKIAELTVQADDIEELIKLLPD